MDRPQRPPRQRGHRLRQPGVGPCRPSGRFPEAGARAPWRAVRPLRGSVHRRSRRGGGRPGRNVSRAGARSRARRGTDLGPGAAGQDPPPGRPRGRSATGASLALGEEPSVALRARVEGPGATASPAGFVRWDDITVLRGPARPQPDPGWPAVIAPPLQRRGRDSASDLQTSPLGVTRAPCLGPQAAPCDTRQPRVSRPCPAPPGVALSAPPRGSPVSRSRANNPESVHFAKPESGARRCHRRSSFQA